MAHVFQDYRYSLRRTGEPSYLPVTLTDALEQLDFGTVTDADKRKIENNLFPAVEMAEDDSQRSFASQTWKLRMDFFPPVVELRRPPIVSVDSVQYIDLDGATQTWSSSNYDTDLSSAPGRIIPADTSTGWPSTNDEPNAVIVTFTAGYVNEAVPAKAIKAILLALKALYYDCDPSSAYWSLIDRLRWESGL